MDKKTMQKNKKLHAKNLIYLKYGNFKSRIKFVNRMSTKYQNKK